MFNLVRGLFGYGPEGTPERKALVSLSMKLTFGLGQLITIITLLAIAGHTKSPTVPDLNEWKACSKPLGAWAVLWALRAGLGCIVAMWAYSVRPTGPRNRRPGNPASGTNNTANGGQPAGNFQVQPRIDEAPTNATRPNTAAPDRLDTLITFISTLWFIVGHILVYTTVKTCRLSSPHVWWLNFAILCIGYMIVLELIAVVLIIFVIGPLFFILINLILVCMGRDPLNFHHQPHHEIGKLSAKAVDQIPLVLYIPSPEPKDLTKPEDEKDTSGITPPGAAYSYPPQPRRQASMDSIATTGTRVQGRSRRWFTFRRLRRKRGDSDGTGKGGKSEKSKDTYEDKWEKGEYPFVKLPENRASCAICICDFEEPKRVRYSVDSSRPPQDLDEAEAADGINVDPAQRGEHGGGNEGELRLEDPGEGAQPLRLLGCAHVFHKTCIDPWLTEVSGRCPVCQRPVEVEVPPTSKRRRS
ncbi:hypothetical protein M422DRAFT_59190 [Sphaerobolus stellatus SS14]|nr:hypothetical protein M422DRAFT_59190 [Sphaerobolus stellatus SS14]